MVGLGAFVTTIAQPGVIGRLPLQLLLKNELHFNAQTLAAFMVITTFAWNVKPLAGILSDAFPLFGTRRRHYMLLGAGMAAVCWFLMGVVPRANVPLLLTAFGANAFMVIASTVMGGLMVEAGRKYGISGRVTSIARRCRAPCLSATACSAATSRRPRSAGRWASRPRCCSCWPWRHSSC
jgi:hypothetical protein